MCVIFSQWEVLIELTKRKNIVQLELVIFMWLFDYYSWSPFRNGGRWQMRDRYETINVNNEQLMNLRFWIRRVSTSTLVLNVSAHVHEEWYAANWCYCFRNLRGTCDFVTITPAMGLNNLFTWITMTNLQRIFFTLRSESAVIFKAFKSIFNNSVINSCILP